MVSLNDMADRPPRPLADLEVLDLGAKTPYDLAAAYESRYLGSRGAPPILRDHPPSVYPLRI